MGLNLLLQPHFDVLQAAILQQTAEYIFTLEQEKTRLLQQNSQLKRIIQVQVQQAAWIFPYVSSVLALIWTT